MSLHQTAAAYPLELRSSQAWRVSVVHVGTPVPRRSLSFVHTAASSATRTPRAASRGGRASTATGPRPRALSTPPHLRPRRSPRSLRGTTGPGFRPPHHRCPADGQRPSRAEAVPTAPRPRHLLGDEQRPNTRAAVSRMGKPAGSRSDCIRRNAAWRKASTDGASSCSRRPRTLRTTSSPTTGPRWRSGCHAARRAR